MIINNVSKKELNKKQNGITLISLVITMAVMVILAAISINFLLGENGIIAKAKGAATNYSDSEVKEKLEMGISDINTEFLDNVLTNDEFANKLNEKMENKIEWVYKDSLAGNYMGKDFTIINGEPLIGFLENYTIKNSNSFYSNKIKEYAKYKRNISNITISIEDNLDKYVSGEIINDVINDELPSSEENKNKPWDVSKYGTKNIFA